MDQAHRCAHGTTARASRAGSTALAPLLVFAAMLAGCPGRMDGDAGDAADVPRPDARPDAVTPEAGPDAPLDAPADARPDAAPDAAPDTALDATPDTVPDAAPDAAPEPAVEAGVDAPVEAGLDAMIEAGLDAAPDAAPDDAAPDTMIGDGSMPGVRVAEVAGGFVHTCARLTDGTVRCWGDNAQGQLGLGTTAAAFAPVVVPGLTNVIQIDAGDDFTCALLMDGTVRCWGDNANLQTGTSTSTADVLSPTPVAGLTGVVEIALGSDHACARLMDGTAQCWGDSDNLQLGRGTTSTTDSAMPAPVAGLTNAIDLAAGQDHTCAIVMGGTARCWGANANGESGSGAAGSTDLAMPTMVAGLTDAVQIAAGDNHTCVRRTGGLVSCWGDNFSGQLGVGDVTDRAMPVEVMGLAGAADVQLGADHTCAVLAPGGALRCWGENDNGQVGNGVVGADIPVPVAVMGVPAGGARAVAGGADHTCVIGTDDALYCWGEGEEGHLGVSPRRLLTPTPVTGLTGRVLGVAASVVFRGHVCARVTGDTVACWGTNDNGQLGAGDTLDRARPVAVAGVTNAVQVVVGFNHTCVRLMDGTAQCWGDNADGELGAGDTTDRSAPVAVAGLTGAAYLAAGADTNCAIVAGGAVRCWGDNDNGQIGDNTTTDRPTPTDVMGLTSVVELAGGGDHVCARLMGGTVQCWGDNDNGQLGIGSTADSRVPAPAIATLMNVEQVVAGQNHTCARLMGGTVQCWGDNLYGQLGDGTMTDRSTPVAVAGLTNVVQLAAGNNFTCARLMDGSVRCWGYNEEGHFGDGTTTNQSTPVAMMGASGIENLAGGNSVACVVAASDGALRCLGFVAHGQLGVGLSLRWTTPQRVTF